MLEDNIVVATTRTVVATSYSRHYGGSKGKRGKDDQDNRGKRDSRDSRCANHHNEAGGSGDRAAESPRQDNNTKQTRFTLPPSQLLSIIQSLQGFEWPRHKRGYQEWRDKSRYYKYHRDVEHRTNECYRLRRLLNFLVKRGHLREYIEEVVLNSSQPLPHTSSRPVIDTILAGQPSPRIWG